MIQIPLNTTLTNPPAGSGAIGLDSAGKLRVQLPDGTLAATGSSLKSVLTEDFGISDSTDLTPTGLEVPLLAGVFYEFAIYLIRADYNMKLALNSLQSMDGVIVHFSGRNGVEVMGNNYAPPEFSSQLSGYGYGYSNPYVLLDFVTLGVSDIGSLSFNSDIGSQPFGIQRLEGTIRLNANRTLRLCAAQNFSYGAPSLMLAGSRMKFTPY